MSISSSTSSYSARMSLGWYDSARVYYYYYYYSTHGFIAGVLTTVASWAAWHLLTTRSKCWSSSSWRRLLHKDATTTTCRSVSTINDNTVDKGDDADDLIYLDYNGTTPVYPAVRDAMLPYFSQHYGNPGSAHALGDVPKRAVATVRRQILTHLLGCHDKECNDDEFARSAIVFTACGTESDNLIIHWALSHAACSSTFQTSVPSKKTQSPPLPHIVTSNVEHPAVDACLAAHERNGTCTVTRVPVQRNGRVRADDVIAAIQYPHTCVAMAIV
jgi:selenocysteine lyase/cysteine desulfurase